MEQIKRSAVVPAFWGPGGEEIAPAMKRKRRPIAAGYAEVIESMYVAAEPVLPGFLTAVRAGRAARRTPA